MKKIAIFTLAFVLVCTLAACGCQMRTEPDAGTHGTTNTTAPTIIDPTILDPTFETNIPDSTVNENSTDGTSGHEDRNPTGGNNSESGNGTGIGNGAMG